jgi:hypothetical protein
MYVMQLRLNTDVTMVTVKLSKDLLAPTLTTAKLAIATKALASKRRLGIILALLQALSLEVWPSSQFSLEVFATARKEDALTVKSSTTHEVSGPRSNVLPLLL